MRIAVINETSSADRNADIMAALEGTGHEIVNAGMTKTGEAPELNYIHTGCITALLLNSGRVDFVVGGCGTGQGYLNAAMQFPGVFCGHIMNSLDAWLFTQINGGNCVSLALNQGYGWAADVNLAFIIDRLFSVERGSGYPAHRKGPQKKARDMLEEVSRTSHRSMAEIVRSLPHEVILPVLTYPGVMDLLEPESIEDEPLGRAIIERMK